MNNEFKWAIQDTIKDYLLTMVKQGQYRNKIIITKGSETIMDVPEIVEAINSLVFSEYIEELEGKNGYVITEGYYNYLLENTKNDLFNLEEEQIKISISPKLKQRFCKDMGIPISIYKEPYFESRIKLYDSQYNTVSKYKSFIELVKDFETEQDYFEYYNKLKDNIINYLGEQEGIKRLKEDDMNKYKIKNEGFPKKDIYKETNDGKTFLSIDMIKANFSSLKHYDENIFGGDISYEDFIGRFTSYDYFKNSKYLRQVVFGNHSPKRQVSYEKYLMDKVVTELLKVVPKENIVFFSNDEIVIELNEEELKDNEYIEKIREIIMDFIKKENIQLREEIFRLKKISGTDGYVKKFIDNNKKDEFKCLDSLTLPFVLRAYLGEDIKEEDKVFYYEGKLARLIEVPKIEVA